MSKLMAALAAALFCISAAQAQDKKPTNRPAAPAAQERVAVQPGKMGDCTKEAKQKELSGDAHKRFMSDCLKDEPAAPAAAAPKPADQQQKMGYCNQEAGAKQLKGDERKKFMSACLKG